MQVFMLLFTISVIRNAQVKINSSHKNNSRWKFFGTGKRITVQSRSPHIERIGMRKMNMRFESESDAIIKACEIGRIPYFVRWVQPPPPSLPSAEFRKFRPTFENRNRHERDPSRVASSLIEILFICIKTSFAANGVHQQTRGQITLNVFPFETLRPHFASESRRGTREYNERCYSSLLGSKAGWVWVVDSNGGWIIKSRWIYSIS